MLKHLLLVIVAKTQAPDRIDTGLKARITEFSCTVERHGVLKSSGVQTAIGNLKQKTKSFNQDFLLDKTCLPQISFLFQENGKQKWVFSIQL